MQAEKIYVYDMHELPALMDDRLGKKSPVTVTGQINSTKRRAIGLSH